MTKRYLLACLASIGFLILFGLRCSIGIAIVHMTNFDDISRPEFDWDWETIGLIQTSYFIGCLISQIPGGFLAARYKANIIFGTGIVTAATLHFFVPMAAKLGYQCLIIVRILQGLADGVTFPACHEIWKWWAPPLERTRLVTLTICGSYLGAVVGRPVSEWLAEGQGWAAIFYFYGLVGIVWYIFWIWLSYDKPRNHPTITQEELDYIEKSIGHVDLTPLNLKTTPWPQIFRSMPVYSIMVASFCQSWTFSVIIFAHPTYFAESFDYNTAPDGEEIALGSFPFLIMGLVVPIGGILADYLRKSNFLSTTQVRKLFNCGGFATEAVLLLLIVVAKYHFVFNMVSLNLAVLFAGIAISGFSVNHLDIAPKYAGVLMGISNVAGILAAFLCPVVVHKFTENMEISEWHLVFILAVTVQFVGVVFYGVFASGEQQPWAKPGVNCADEYSIRDEMETWQEDPCKPNEATESPGK